jgi:uncharacterized membrane protein YphA (DoxX/SURF4 family)
MSNQLAPLRDESTIVRTLIDIVTGFLSRHSVSIMQRLFGVVFLAFGVLKFFPGVSPAEELAQLTMAKLSFGIVSGYPAGVVVAIAECIVGITMITGLFYRLGVVVLGLSLAGIVSPMILFTDRLLPGGLPTLEGQYVFKDLILVGGALVLAATALGAKLRTGEDS